MEGIPIDVNVTPKTDMERLLEGIDKEKYFYDLWKDLDPTPNTEHNELMDEYYKRVSYANENFDGCHGITIDTRDKNNMTLLITSRSKNEFKRFTLDGIYIETISLPGCWICRPVIKGGNLFFAVIVTKTWDKYDGMLAVLDRNNKVLLLCKLERLVIAKFSLLTVTFF